MAGRAKPGARRGRRSESADDRTGAPRRNQSRRDEAPRSDRRGDRPTRVVRANEGARPENRTRPGESARPTAARPPGGGTRRAAARCDGESRRGDDRATVLAVDDEPSLAALYEAWLGGRFEVVTAHTGEAALDRLTGEVDVVVLDRQLPGIDGDEVLRRIEGSPFEPRVAMVSALEPDVGAIGAEPDEYLVKPVDRGRLTRTIESLASDGDGATSDGGR